MDLSGSNPRDNVKSMGSSGKSNKGSTEDSASAVPSYTSFEDYDVFSGGLTQSEYMTSTFHTSAMSGGDASFKSKAELLGGSGSSLLSDAGMNQTPEDDSEESKTKEQATKAAL
jgi:hypothetical protein